MIIYKATNGLTGKSYIGQLTFSIEKVSIVDIGVNGFQCLIT